MHRVVSSVNSIASVFQFLRIRLDEKDLRIFGTPNAIPINVTIYDADQTNEIFLIEIVAQVATSTAVSGGKTTPIQMHTTDSLPTHPSTNFGVSEVLRC